MLIRLGYDLQFQIPAPVAMIALLTVHPRRRADLREPDRLRTEPEIPVELYEDVFGNLCSRFLAPAGLLRLSNLWLRRIGRGRRLRQNNRSGIRSRSSQIQRATRLRQHQRRQNGTGEPDLAV